MKVERVPLAVDAQVRYAIGPLRLPLRAVVILGIAFLPATWTMALPLGGTLRLLAPLLIMSLAVAASAPTAEGIWIGTYGLHRLLDPLLPAVISAGRPAHARVVEIGRAVEVRNRAVGPLSRAFAQRLWPSQRARRVEDGLFELDPGGWRAILAIDVPPAAISGDDYAHWIDAVISWLTATGVPAQFLACSEHHDGLAAVRMFDDRARGMRTPLVDRERDLVGALSAETFAIRNYVVLCPGTAGEDGVPYVRRFGGLASVPAPGRQAADRALATALRLLSNHSIRAAPCPEGRIRELLADSCVGAPTALRTRAGMLIGDDHQASICVLALPPVVHAGTAVASLLRTRTRGLASLYIAPVQPQVARRKVNVLRQAYRHAAASGGDIDTRVMLEDVELLASELASRQRSAHMVALTLAVRGEDRASCDAQVEKVLGSLEADGFRATRCTVPGFDPAAALAPGGAPLRRALILTTNGVGACLLPAMGTPFADAGDPLVGINVQTGTPAHVSVFRGRRNMNLLCVGTSGAGKSVALKTLLFRHAVQGARAVVIDPDSEYQGVMEAVGGVHVELGRHAINVLHVGRGVTQDDAAAHVLPALSVMAGNEVAMAADGHPVRRLPDEDKGWLHGEVADFYARWRRMQGTAEPVLGDLLDYLEAVSWHRSLTDVERDRCRVITARLRTFTHGARARVFNRRTSFDPGGASVAVGLRELALQYRADLTPALAIILGFVLGEMTSRREPMIVLVDEAHHVTSDPDAGHVLARMVRQARKYGAGVWMASQQVEDFLAADGLGRTLAATAATKVILGLEASMADDAAAAFKLTPAETRCLVEDCPPGRAVVLSGDERAVVDVLPGDHLLELVNTTRRDWAA